MIFCSSLKMKFDNLLHCVRIAKLFNFNSLVLFTKMIQIRTLRGKNNSIQNQMTTRRKN